MDFAFGEGFVLDAFGNDVHLTGIEVDGAVAEIEAQMAFEDEEGLVGVFVMMPDEVALKFDELELVVVHLGDHFGGPVVVDEGEFLGEVDGGVGHVGSILCLANERMDRILILRA